MFGNAAEDVYKTKDLRSPQKPQGQQPVRSDSDIAISLNGEATAVGENTSVNANLFSRAYDRGAVQVAFGAASLTAVSVSSPSAPAYAATHSSVDIAGADYSYTSTQKRIEGGDHQKGSWSMEQSQTYFVAFNIVGWDTRIGSVNHYAEAITDSGVQPPALNGNVASFDVDAKAYGDDSFVHADSMSMATNGFSTSSNSVMAGVGSNRVGAKPILGGSRSDTILASNADTFVDAGAGKDRVIAGKGDDWISSGAGNDVVFAGAGNNTVLAGEGNDVVTASNGDDWIFGGDGKDMISAGSGNNIVNGGEGSDTIIGGCGDDVIIGGMGKDLISTGSGRNIVRMGLGGTKSDGDDTITTGHGQDLLFLDGCFGRDEVWGFSIGQGDRLLVSNDHDVSASLTRSKANPLDLIVTVGSGRTGSVLALDDFFLYNPGYGSPFSRAPLTRAQEASIRQDIFMNGPDDQLAETVREYFLISDYLGLLG